MTNEDFTIAMTSNRRFDGFLDSLSRIEQLLTAALLTHNREDYERYMLDANAIVGEWNLNEELRASLLEAAHENTIVGRSFHV